MPRSTVFRCARYSATIAFAAEAAVSESSPWRSGINVASASDWGAALRGTWDIIGSQNVGALRLSAEHRFGDFRAPGQLQLFRDGILTPVFEYRSSFAATYTREIASRWQGTITGRYDVADPKAVSRRQLAVHGDRYHIDVGVSHQLTDSISVSAIVGWSNEVYNRSLVSLADPNLHDTNGQIWAGLRLYWRPAPRTTVSASTDTLNQRSLVSGTTSTGNGIGSWTATATLADDRVRDRSTTSAAATYRGERAEATVGHDSGLRTSISGRAVNVDAGDQRTRARVGTAIVFADGHAGVSAPIRGDSAFAILSPHPSIGNREVTAGSQDYPRARSGVLGPAVAGNLPAHVPQVLPIDVENLPPGYSLGQSGFDLKPPYRAGYVLPVGSDAAVSAYGVLLDPRGDPVSLAAGTASKGERHLTVFSSEAGRFALNGVAPGRWRVVLETDGGQLIYFIDVPQGTTLLDLGQVRPARGKLS